MNLYLSAGLNDLLWEQGGSCRKTVKNHPKVRKALIKSVLINTATTCH